MSGELVMYPVIGFLFTYLALETAWHFTACKSHDKTLAPCVFKQVKMLLR
jgi:hypothetical protein